MSQEMFYNFSPGGHIALDREQDLQWSWLTITTEHMPDLGWKAYCSVATVLAGNERLQWGMNSSGEKKQLR